MIHQPCSRAIFLAVATGRNVLQARRSPEHKCRECLRSGAFLGCDLVWSGNSLPPFRDNLSVKGQEIEEEEDEEEEEEEEEEGVNKSKTKWIFWRLEMGPLGCPATPVANCHYTLCSVPEDALIWATLGWHLEINVWRMRLWVDCSWNVMAYGDAREGNWRGNWRLEWVASTLHTTSEHGVSSIITADAHTSAAISRLNWRPRRFKWTRPFRRKTKSGFCACAITFQPASNIGNMLADFTRVWNVEYIHPLLDGGCWSLKLGDVTPPRVVATDDSLKCLWSVQTTSYLLWLLYPEHACRTLFRNVGDTVWYSRIFRPACAPLWEFTWA